MGKRTRCFASSIAFVAAAAATPAFACDGVPCLPTSCLAGYYSHGHTLPTADAFQSVPIPPTSRLITGNLAPVVGPQLPGATVNVGPNVFPGAGLLSSRGGDSRGPSLQAFNSKSISLMSQLPLNQMGGVSGTAGSSLYGWVDPQNQREYAIMGRSNGTAIVDITNPRVPVYVGNVLSLNNSSWREPKVYGNYAYIGVDGTSHKMQIVDLTQVRSYTGTPLNMAYSTFNGTFSGSGVNNIHTLQIDKDSGYLYLSGTSLNSGAPLIVDVRNPGNPVPAGTVPSLDGYSHETQIVTYHGPDAAYAGREIMLSSNGKSGGGTDTFSVVDVTNKSSPTRLSSKTYAGAAYIHQGWLTEDHRYFFQNDELDEPNQTTSRTKTHLWDVSDLNNPVYKGAFVNTTSSIDHNLYVKDGYVYQTNYTTGLRILKIGNLESSNSNEWLTEVAYFDTYALNDNGGTGTGFHGAWNNYPYFPSGNIAVSDIDGGLFVLKPEIFGKQYGEYVGPIGLGPLTLVPEPTSLALVALAGVSGMCRRRRGRA